MAQACTAGGTDDDVDVGTLAVALRGATAGAPSAIHARHRALAGDHAAVLQLEAGVLPVVLVIFVLHDRLLDHGLVLGDVAALGVAPQFRGVLREEAADMKAIEGWEEPVFQQAKFVGWVRRYSDRMHEIMLKAGNPVKFAERHEIGGVGGKDLPSAIIMLPMGVPAPKAEE